MPVFNRSEQIVLLLLSAALIIGAGVRLTEHYVTDLPDFHVMRGAVTPPTVGKPASTEEPTSHTAPSAALTASASILVRVDINSASGPQLVTLPGVGPRTAERILAYRKSYGRFNSVDEMVNVKGIGAKTIERLRPHLVLGQP